jgi:uncharacterized membrane protein YccC
MKVNLNMAFGMRNAVFALNIYLATVLALFVAFSLDLPNPWWAMMTVVLTSQPLAGAVWARALYRVIGTVIGVAVIVILVPPLSSTPELLIGAIALWTAACLYVSQFDRTARSSGFMLSGYTVALVGLPLATNPINIFDIGVARCEEIVIGVLCAALVHTLIFPVSATGVFQTKLQAVMGDARSWIANALDLATNEGSFEGRTISVDLIELNSLAFSTGYENGTNKQVIRTLEEHLIALLPLTSAAEDRIVALKEFGELPASTLEALGRTRQWIENPKQIDPTQTERLLVEIASLAPVANKDSTWPDMLGISLVERLTELVRSWSVCVALASTLSGSATPVELAIARNQESRGHRVLHVDHGIALLSAVTVATTIVGLGLFTIAAEWNDGPVAIGIAAVLASLFLSADDPTSSVRSFAVWNFVAIVAATFYVFAILEVIDGFPPLAAALLPILFVIGFFLSSPAHFHKALPIAVGFSAGVAFQPTFNADFETFANLNLALVIGVLSSLVGVSTMRALPVERVAHRILRAGWHDLASLCGARQFAPRNLWVSRMLDRLGLLIPRIAKAQPNEVFDVADALRDLRIGVAVIALRGVRDNADSTTRVSIDQWLTQLRSHFRLLAKGRDTYLSNDILHGLDRILSSILLIVPESQRIAGIGAVVALRRNLFPGTGPFQQRRSSP